MLNLSSKFDRSSHIIFFAKTASKKFGTLICSIKFLSLEGALYLINLQYGHAWNTVVMSRLVLLVATWNSWKSYKNGYAGLLVLHLLPLLNQPAQVFSIGITSVDYHLNWPNWFHFLTLDVGLLNILIDCMTFSSPFLDITRISMSTVSFLAQLNSGILCL